MPSSSFIPILLVTVLNIFLAMLWYSPLLFGTMWAKAYKLDPKKLKPTPFHYLGSFMVSFVTVLVLAILIDQFQIMAWQCGILLGIFLWLGFIVTTHFSGVIWAQKPLRGYLIDISYHLVSLSLMSALLASWL